MPHLGGGGYNILPFSIFLLYTAHFILKLPYANYVHEFLNTFLSIGSILLYKYSSTGCWITIKQAHSESVPAGWFFWAPTLMTFVCGFIYIFYFFLLYHQGSLLNLSWGGFSTNLLIIISIVLSSHFRYDIFRTGSEV